ncbi:MAG: hypothetical protein AB7V42_09075 [Thermoleophilia bacterium]
MDRTRQRGQATVEAVGIVVVVALLMAALGPWMARELRPPDRPPDPVTPVAGLLEPSPIEMSLSPLAARPLPDFLLDTDGAGPIGRFLRSVPDRVARVARIGFRCHQELQRTFQGRLREHGRAMLDDPLSLLDAPDVVALLESDRGLDRIVSGTRDLWRYGRTLPGLGAEGACMKVAADAGPLLADGAVEALKIAVRKGLSAGADRVLRRTPPPPAPRRDVPPSSRRP